MIAEKMKKLVNNSSAIRAMFEEGKKMAESTARKTSMISALEIPMFRRLLR